MSSVSSIQMDNRWPPVTPATEGGILPYGPWGHLHTRHTHVNEYKILKYWFSKMCPVLDNTVFISLHIRENNAHGHVMCSDSWAASFSPSLILGLAQDDSSWPVVNKCMQHNHSSSTSIGCCEVFIICLGFYNQSLYVQPPIHARNLISNNLICGPSIESDGQY